MTKLYGTGIFLMGIASVGLMGVVIYLAIADDLRLKKLRKKAEEEEWPDYDQYLKDLEES